MRSRSGYARPAAAVLVAILLLPTIMGCGDDPYKAAAKDVARTVSNSAEEFKAVFSSAPIEGSGAVDQATVDIRTVQMAITDTGAAVSGAADRLRELTPPPEARSFQSQYLAGLQEYGSSLDTLARTLDYADAAFAALAAVLTQEGQTGVWAEVAEITARGVNESNVAEAAVVFDEAQRVLHDSAARWGATGPPQFARSAHDAVASRIEGLAGTFSEMAGLSAAAAEPGSGVDLSPIVLLWELGLDQWEGLLGDIDAWFTEVDHQIATVAADLEDVQERLDHLVRSLNDL